MINIRVSGASPDSMSETDIRLNYGDPSKIIAASNDIGGIGGGGTTAKTFLQAQFYSTDGGASWNPATLPFATGDIMQSDPAVDWTTDGTAWAATLGGDGSGFMLRTYNSPDSGKTWNLEATPSGTATDVDRDIMWVDHSTTSQYLNQIYVIYHTGTIAFIVRRTAGATGSWQTPVQISGIETTGTPIGGDVKTNSFGDVFVFWPDTGGTNNIFVVKSTNGGASFGALGTTPVKIGTTFASDRFISIPAFPRTVSGGTVFSRGARVYISGGAYRTANQDLAYAVWTDLSGDPGCTSGQGPGTNVASTCKSRIFFSRSTDGGAHWSTPVLLNNQTSLNDQFHSRLVVDESNGNLAVFYYDTVNDPGRLMTDLWMQTSTDNGVTWSDPLKVTTVQTDETAAGTNQWKYGDYLGATGFNGTFFPAWTDRRSGNDEIWTSKFTQDANIILNRNPIGQDEVDARRMQPGGLPLQNAFRVVVDGFTAPQLGLTSSGSTLANLPVVSPATGIIISASTPLANTADNGDYKNEIQRFTFYFDIGFTDSTDPAFTFPGLSEDIALNAMAGGFTAFSVLTLIKQPDPFLLHGDPSDPTDPSWLSIDLRVFVVHPNDTWFGIPVPPGFNASAAPSFIQQVINALNQPNSTVRGDFDNLPKDESAKLFVHPTDGPTGPLVFNFALARVHFIGLLHPATNVRVFFRLFNAQTTTSAFDYPPGAQYRRATSNPSNQPIPLAGIQGTDYVTIPCFAHGRIDSTVLDMSQQPDDYNIQSFPATGAEVDMYFGCWLDINQLSPSVLPAQVPPLQDGPFNPSDPNPDFQPQPVQSAILKNLHQCLIAEIAFDPTPIPIGKDTSNWDKLAQRNLAWSDAGSAQALSTFEIRPTPSGLPADQMPDELMIDWGNTPSSSAQIYLPAVNVDDILTMAARMYTSHRLVRVDDHTLQCQCSTGGITYVPIPPGSDINYTGLLSVNLPATLQIGQIFNIVVRQVTNAFGNLPQPPREPQVTTRATTATAVEPSVSESESEIEWRSILGTFQLTIPVKTKEVLLGPEEQDLSVLRWIQKAIPVTSRWSPTFQRYVNGIADRVRAFGGNPDNIPPSPTGTVTFGNIYGTNFDDKNRNGKRDVGEEGLPGWTIRLVGVDTLTMKPVNREGITDANGNYAFMSVNPGIYQVFEMFDVSKAGWVPTTPVTVPINLKAGETINVNFGNRRIV